MKGRKLFGDERVITGDKRADRIVNFIVKSQQADVCTRVTLTSSRLSKRGRNETLDEFCYYESCRKES